MKTIRNACSTVLAAVRPFAIAAACALLIFSSASPALAFGGSSSNPSDGVEQLDKVQSKSENAISDAGAKVQKNAAKGLNGVQGNADKDKMVSPSDAQGKTIEGTIKDALDDIKR